MNSLQKWFRDRVSRWCTPGAVAILGMLLALPSLAVGLQLDDYSIRATILGCRPIEGVPVGRWNPFVFLDGDPAHALAAMDQGWLPWWADPECRLAFMRPLSTLTHALDYRLLRLPLLMHLQSLLWYGALVWVAAVLYRRLMGGTSGAWPAALAGLMYAIDDAHGFPAGWLANRNSLVAGLFGLLAIIAYDRWRRDGWRPGAWLAPMALAAGLLGKESAAAVFGYLVAYALFLDGGPARRRLGALAPSAAVGLAWFALYKWLGYGAAASGVYVDPAAEPVHFLNRLATYGPILLLGQWALPAADLSLLLSPAAFVHLWLAALAFLALLGLMLAPMFRPTDDDQSQPRQAAVGRFWLTGMMLALVPACAALPGNRLLTFVGLGAMGLLAQWLGGLVEGAGWLPRSRFWRWPARPLVWLMILIHLLLAPLLLPVGAISAKYISKNLAPFAATLPGDADFTTQTAVMVNADSWFGVAAVLMKRHHDGWPLPARVLYLGPACDSLTLSRTNDRTLVVRPDGGYQPDRRPNVAGRPPPGLSPGNAIWNMDLLVRGRNFRLPLGRRIELSTATVEITATTPDGRPAEATFHFRVPLEDRSLRWLMQEGDRFFPFVPPTVGRRARVEQPHGR